MPRTRTTLALAIALLGLTVGCNASTQPASDVTASSATLNGQVNCAVQGRGSVRWELRKTGGAWQYASSAIPIACPAPETLKDGRLSAPAVSLSKTVPGLRAGVDYQYRLAADPSPDGGQVFRSNATGFTTRRFSPGLVSTADIAKSATAAGSLGADVVRVEYDIATPAAAMRDGIAAIVARGARPLLLAGFHGRIPTSADARNLAGWAAAYGPGGSFWAGRSDGRLAVQQIEFGNETSYGYQYGDSWSASSYAARAETYARRFAEARYAIAATGRDVGLLAQADDGGSGSRVWVDSMFRAVPGFGKLVDGWTVHPYGPRDTWKSKLDRLVAHTSANGAPANIPIDVTEYGLSSDDGRALSGNYGWSASQTYDQAASAIKTTVYGMMADRAVGPRLRLFMVYAAHDLSATRSSTGREAYFGVLRSDLAEKGSYSTAIRGLFAD